MNSFETALAYVARGWTPVLQGERHRFLVLQPRPTPLAGECPMCTGIMDETGCRARLVGPNEIPALVSVPQIVQVFCARKAELGGPVE